MRFILPTDAIEKLNTLRRQYQKDKKINLDSKPSMLAMPTLLGGIDVASRNKQIAFIEKILCILGVNLKHLDEIKSLEELYANHTASKVCISACIYIQSQNSKKSLLTQLINQNLGVSPENFLDDEDTKACFLTSYRVMQIKSAFEESNCALKKARLPEFSEEEWRDFNTFIKKSLPDEVNSSPYEYPISSLTQPLFRSAFAYTGTTLGILTGDIITRSTKVMSSQLQLTAAIGSSIVLLGPVGPSSIALFAPMIAGKLINTFCSLTLASMLSSALGMLGHGVGTVVGLPLDLAYHLVWKVCAIIGGYYYTEPKQPMITGIRIKDGVAIIAGIPIEITSGDALLKSQKNIIEFKEDGSIYQNKTLIFSAQNNVLLPPEAITELNDYFSKYAQKYIEQAPSDTRTLVINDYIQAEKKDAHLEALCEDEEEELTTEETKKQNVHYSIA